jgi:hypothetical protein
MWHAQGRVEVHSEFVWGNLKETGHLEDLHIDGSIIIKCFIAVLILMSETLKNVVCCQAFFEWYSERK